jgi:hypothetical protein
MMIENEHRVNAEWVALSAFRGLTKIASNGDMGKSTYDNALDLGGALYPELLGPENSVLRRERESDTTKEYRQRATLMSVGQPTPTSPLELVNAELEILKRLLKVSEQNKDKKKSVDQLRRKVGQLTTSQNELDEVKHSENQLIFRDAYNVTRTLPSLKDGHAYRDFALPDGKILRLRVLHPDKPEHITGADIIYERHHITTQSASVVVVQYKTWEEKRLYLSDPRMHSQLGKMQKFLCERGYCAEVNTHKSYRFPHCSAFLRPTDKLQNSDQKFISTGEHLPICCIDQCTTTGEQGASILEYSGIKHMSLSSDLFEHLFNKERIGSRQIPYAELGELYAEHSIISQSDTVVIYAQEF